MLNDSLQSRFAAIGSSLADRLFRDSTPIAKEERAFNPKSIGGFIQERKRQDEANDVGRFAAVGNYVARGENRVNSQLRGILEEAARRSGLNIQAFSGYRGGSTGNHGTGNATDVRIIGPDGKALKNYQSPETFAAYQNFANHARTVQQERHPELNDSFRWGGYFWDGGPGGYGSLDLMHFDISNKRGMAGGTWDDGPNKRTRVAYGIAGGGGMRTFAAGKMAQPAPSTLDAAERGMTTASAMQQQPQQPARSPINPRDPGMRMVDLPNPNAQQDRSGLGQFKRVASGVGEGLLNGGLLGGALGGLAGLLNPDGRQKQVDGVIGSRLFGSGPLAALGQFLPEGRSSPYVGMGTGIGDPAYQDGFQSGDIYTMSTGGGRSQQYIGSGATPLSITMRDADRARATGGQIL
jgi:hypothetical protein